MTDVEQVPADAWRQWVDSNGARLIDVREPHEWATGALADAERISLGSLASQIDELDRTQPLLLVCRSGARSNQAARALSEIGFKTANLSGGLIALGIAS
jgi:rhodanese-related sulfurtransferase